jgi:hypothetical protein
VSPALAFMRDIGAAFSPDAAPGPDRMREIYARHASRLLPPTPPQLLHVPISYRSARAFLRLGSSTGRACWPGPGLRHGEPICRRGRRMIPAA